LRERPRRRAAFTVVPGGAGNATPRGGVVREKPPATAGWKAILALRIFVGGLANLLNIGQDRG
jgi:hypothetical protein